MAENKVSVEITLEEKAALKALTQLTKEVQKTEQGFTKLGEEGDKSIGLIGRAASGVSSGFKSLVGGVTVANLASEAIIGTANAIKNFALESVSAAAESEQATNRLGQSLRAVGAFSEQTVADFLGFASALSEVTKFSDDAIVEQLSLAKSFGASNQQAKDLVKAATELSATFGGSLESRVQQLGKTLQGTGGKLDTLIPGFKALTEEQLKSGAALDFINGKFGGAAANEITTYAGKLELAKKAFGEFQETLGGFVLDTGIVDYFTAASFAINRFNQSISDSKIANDRQKAGFVETTASLDQLKREYDDLRVKAIDLEQTILNPQNGALADKTAIFIAKKQLTELNNEIARTKSQIDTISPKVQAGVANAPQGTIATEIPLVDPKKEAEAVKLRADTYAQLEIARATYNAGQIEQDVLSTQLTEENYAFELERLQSAEQMKIDAVYAAEEQKALAISDGKAKQYALLKVAADKEAALEKSKLDTQKKVETAQVALKQQTQAAMAGIIGSSFTLLATLAKDGSKEQFLIQKAAAIAEIAIADGKARALIPAQTALIPFPGNIPAAATLNAYVTAQTAIGLATVAAATIKGFQDGGIVGGKSMSGDRIPVRVNSGEMILNRQQQTELFQMANGSGSSSDSSALERLTSAIMGQPIQLVVDGRVLATVIRKEVQSGFKIT